MLGHNSFAYCLGNPALYEDGFGSRPCITEVLDGRSGTVEEDEYYSEDNIYRFNTDDLRFSEEANYYRIGKSDANRFYHQISAGDFGTIISPPLFHGCLNLLSMEMLFPLLQICGVKRIRMVLLIHTIRKDDYCILKRDIQCQLL